jgi:NitT/TauT family transport system substrate-binding protein
MARRVRLFTFSATGLVLALALAALGPVDRAQGQTKKIRVGYMPIAEQAPNFVAADLGIFKKHGLDIELKLFQSGPAIGAAQLGGSIDVGLIGTPGAIFAWAAGKPLYAFADIGTNVDVKPWSYSTGLVTRANSPLKDFGDVKGKKIGVNVLKANAEIQLMMMARRWSRENPGRAVDLEKDVQLVVMPMPSFPAALEKGIVDAVVPWEPWATAIDMKGGLKVITPVSYALPGWPVGFWLVTKQAALERPEAVVAYREAFYEAADWIRKNDKEARRIIAKWTKVDPELADRMPLPVWEKDLGVLKGRTEKIVEEMVALKLLKEPVDLERYFIAKFPSGWERELR